jgi:HK97 family phage major capsid protein/HK97 family phage prohead protease
MRRAYSLLTVKSVDDDQRIIEGIASTPEPDRQGDIMDPKGAMFSLPLPLLYQHRQGEPIGHVIAATVTDAGIEVRAQIAKGVLPEIDKAWALIKAGLVRGLSIGFRMKEAAFIKDTGGYRVTKWDWLELSAVTIPANADANIQTIKSLDAEHLAASGRARVTPRPGDTGTAQVRLAQKGADPMKNINERKQAFLAEKAAKVAKLNELMGADDGATLAPETQEQFDAITEEVKAIDGHLARLETLEQVNKAAAVPAVGGNVEDAARSRGGQVISIKENLPPGIEFARAVMVKVNAALQYRNPVELAKEVYPDSPRIQAYLKGAVAGANTQTPVWAGALVDPTNLSSEFAEFLRPQTIIGKFGANGIPSLRRIPFNVRIIGQTSGGEGYWVGEGAPKPLTSFQVAPTTLTWAKVGNIAVVTKEMMRFSSPSAEMLVRDELARAIVERIDTDFVDPAKAASTNVSPASITNGLSALSSAGTSADNARTDIANLLEQFILNNIDPTNLVLIMPNTLCLALSVMVNSLGQPEFPGLTLRGGTLMGIPVIGSQYAANQSGAGNLVIAVNASDIYLSDDGDVTVEMSTEASLQMLDNPTNNALTATPTTMVSMFQAGAVALKAERFINWARRRTAAVAYMDDVNWNAIGSLS